MKKAVLCLVYAAGFVLSAGCEKEAAKEPAAEASAAMDTVTVIVDNEDAGFKTIGGKWNKSTRDRNHYKSNYLWSNKRDGEGKARWRPELEREGIYKVYARWVCKERNPASDRASNATFSVCSGGRRVGEKTFDMSKESGQWNLIGRFWLVRMGTYVGLSNEADHSVVADAVKFQYLGGSAEMGIVYEDFEEGMDNWVVEDKGGHHEVEVKEGRLVVTQKEAMPGIFVWCKKELPESFRLEYDLTPLSRGKEKKGFFLLFFCAKGADGKDIFDDAHWEKSRQQDFKKYTSGVINCYHIGYLRGRTGLCNMRKNPGLVKVQGNEVPQMEEGKTYHVTLRKEKARVTFRVEGPGIEKERETFIDWTDAGEERPVWNGGKFAFRQIGYEVGVSGAYDNVRLVDLDAK